MAKKAISYYILLPGDNEEDTFYEDNLLGESDINGSFWPGSGLKALMKISCDNKELLPEIRIITDQKKSLTVEQFLTDLGKLKVKKYAI